MKSYLKNGGKPISNFWIPVIYPSDKYLYEATMVPVDGPIDLSKIEISIYKPTKDEMYKYSMRPSSGTKYIAVSGAEAEVMIEKGNMDNNNILKLSFRQDTLIRDGGSNIFSLYESKSSEDSLKAAVQLIRLWNYDTNRLLRHDPYSGLPGWYTPINPPLLNLIQETASLPPDQIMADVLHLADISNSPLSVR